MTANQAESSPTLTGNLIVPVSEVEVEDIGSGRVQLTLLDGGIKLRFDKDVALRLATALVAIAKRP